MSDTLELGQIVERHTPFGPKRFMCEPSPIAPVSARIELAAGLTSQPFMHRQPSEHSINCAEGDHFVLTNPNLIVGQVHGTITFA